MHGDSRAACTRACPCLSAERRPGVIGITRRVAYIGHSSHVVRELGLHGLLDLTAGEGCPAARGPDDDAYSRALAAGAMRLTRELYYRFSCTKITAGFLAGAY